MGHGTSVLLVGGMWIFPLIVLAILLVVVYLIFVRAGSSWTDSARPEPRARPETALEILEKRYARGEIDRDEFQQMKKDLS